MKTLLLLSLTIFSVSILAEEVGENQKAPCPYANQSSSRDAKIVVDTSTVANEETATTKKQ
jgi:hypothetical protein